MLRGNKAIVTGASRGIGFAIAKELAQNGCSVVITGRDIETLQQAAEKMEGNVITMVWDVSQIGLADSKIKEAAELMGGLDIVVKEKVRKIVEKNKIRFFSTIFFIYKFFNFIIVIIFMLKTIENYAELS